jgi:hypothetical protein
MLESVQHSLEQSSGGRTPEHDRDLLMAIVLDRQGLFASRLGEPDEARALTERALTLFDRLDAPEARAAALNNVSNRACTFGTWMTPWPGQPRRTRYSSTSAACGAWPCH